MGDDEAGPYVSRAGTKLEAALRHFDLDVGGLGCADFGCHVGGFTDCLLRHGAAKVYALDTGYGVLDYRLRTDARVVVMERTNVLHCPPPAEPVDLVTIDLSWTRQLYAVPAALNWLAADGRIITLVKPHYELDDDRKRTLLVNGVLAPDHAEAILGEVLGALPRLGARVVASMRSPITGAKSARRSGGQGNREYLVLATKAGAADR
ncbi:MAG: SAM-dependent methyltransferase [Planctomycetota bacterium]|jgi:23S rRNA (cytidine1920-2'-O)/16S rRNA (cytidine1409-2'-O)-methyltransferase